MFATFITLDLHKGHFSNWFPWIQERESGQRLNIIIVSEGAIDREGNPITAEMIRKVCCLLQKHCKSPVFTNIVFPKGCCRQFETRHENHCPRSRPAWWQSICFRSCVGKGIHFYACYDFVVHKFTIFNN